MVQKLFTYPKIIFEEERDKYYASNVWRRHEN